MFNLVVFGHSFSTEMCRDRQWTDLQRGGNFGGGGLAGQQMTLHRKKFNFCIIQTILNKISKKFCWPSPGG